MALSNVVSASVIVTERLDHMVVSDGYCGFSVSGGMRSYYGRFGLVEIQSTFYNVPRLETIEKLRTDAPNIFEFAPKMFQGTTHPTSSLTWRRFRGKLFNVHKDSEKYGFLRPTDEVLDCWNMMTEICTRLKSQVTLIQTHPAPTAPKPTSRTWTRC